MLLEDSTAAIPVALAAIGHLAGCGESGLLNHCRSPRADSGGFAEKPEEKHAEFIIDVDENGEEIAFTCNSGRSGELLWGKFRTPPDYLTPVHFPQERSWTNTIRSLASTRWKDSLLALWAAVDHGYRQPARRKGSARGLGDLGRDLLPYNETTSLANRTTSRPREA